MADVWTPTTYEVPALSPASDFPVYLAVDLPVASDTPVPFSVGVARLREMFGEFYEVRFALSVATAWRMAERDLLLLTQRWLALPTVQQAPIVRPLRTIAGTVRQA